MSFVNATGYVAFVSVKAVRDDRYAQAPELGFESATDGGLWNPGPGAITVAGVSIPARSVYWALASQQAGKTYAYYATFRSPNGLVRDLAFDFGGEVHASNAATVVTALATTRLDARASTTFQKNAAGTFIIGGEHYARQNGLITLTVSPTNWWAQPIPYGAQSHFQPVVWDSFQDFIDKGAIASGAAVTPQSGGLKTSGSVGITVRGIAVPKNSVYWVLADMAPGQRLDLSYTVQLAAATGGAVVNACSNPVHEAWFATPQLSVVGVNQCAPGSCAPLNACLPIHIGVDESPGFGFAKGDEINGSAAIRGNYDDNPNAFVTWGQPIDYKLSVGNGGISSLDDVVMYDQVQAGWTLVAASIPASAGTVWYWKGAGVPPTAPSLYTTAPTVDLANWTTTRPASVSWIAYAIPRLRSAYCTGPTSPNGITNCAGTEPVAVVADLSIIPSPAVDVCSEQTIRNNGFVKVYRSTPLSNVTALLATPLSGSDWEDVKVKPLAPDITTSFGGGSGSATPGQTATHTIYVQNRSAVGNPIDTARNVKAVIDLPEVTANGLERTLDLAGLTTDGGTVSYGAGTVTVTWPTLLPNQVKAVTLTYQLPTGIRNATTFRTVANITADRDCIDPQAQVTYQTSVASSPALVVDKDLDYRVVSNDTPVTYTLTYRNNGTAPSTKTWVLDRIADATTLNRVTRPAGGEVWFSDDLPPYNAGNPTSSGLPSALVADFAFSDAVVRAHFAPGPAPDVNGWVAAPAGTKWVAFLVDTATVNGQPVSPPIFPTGLPQTVRLEVVVTDSDAVGQLVTNEPAIVSDELLQSIGHRVEFIVSDEPGLDVAKSCDAVVSTGEGVTYVITFKNDTTNLDSAVVVSDTLPAQFVPDAGGFAFVPPPTSTVIDTTADGRKRYTWTFPPLASLATGTITIHGTVAAGVTSGTFVRNEVLASAKNSDGVERSFYDECATLVENADLLMTKLVDNAEPRSGDTVTYTLQVSNENQRDAANVVVTDTLAAGTTFVGGSLQVLTPGWALTGPPPADGATTLALHLQKTGVLAGVMPGASGGVRVIFKAKVAAAVSPGTALLNSVTATTTTGQDPVFPDTATALATTPLPDPYLQVTTQPLVKPGEVATWTLLYGNGNPEDAANTVVFFSLPDGPGTPGESDFTFATVAAPAGVQVYYSSAPLTARPAFTPGTPPGPGWSATPSGTVNHLAFFVRHCDLTPGSTEPCAQGDIFRNEGPFTILVKATARQPVGTLPAVGQSFTGCGDIQMIGTAFADADLTNNHGCATVKTPGIGLSVSAACDPTGGFPGLPPGGTATFAFSFENTGTVPAYGVQFDVGLDARLSYLFDSAAVVDLTDATGAHVNPLDATGARLQAPLSWGHSGTTLAIGPVGPGSTAYGLAPGDRGTIIVTARVALDVPDSTPLDRTVTGTVLGRPGDVAEVFLDDNTDQCGATVYRADVFVVKSLRNVTDPTKSYADGGDRLYVEIEYGNAGRFAASDVIMTDSLADSLALVAGSQRGVPLGATLETDDGSGTWSYVASGPTDPAVRGVRVHYGDGVAMPARPAASSPRPPPTTSPTAPSTAPTPTRSSRR
ncbi:MAG: DUF11 domain-containing protein [Myxococcota bacterium]